MFTNIIVMIPALVLLIVIGLPENTQRLLRGISYLTSPWSRRSATFTLKERDFVDLARLSANVRSIVAKEIAPNILVPFPGLSLASSMLIGDYDFPRRTTAFRSRHDEQRHALELKLHTWYFIPPGAPSPSCGRFVDRQRRADEV